MKIQSDMIKWVRHKWKKNNNQTISHFPFVCCAKIINFKFVVTFTRCFFLIFFFSGARHFNIYICIFGLLLLWCIYLRRHFGSYALNALHFTANKFFIERERKLRGNCQTLQHCCELRSRRKVFYEFCTRPSRHLQYSTWILWALNLNFRREAL